MEKRRQVIIGIDGVPFRLMEKLSDKKVMPNFRELRRDGVFTKMRSSIPEISSASWSSIITGENPGEHGIYGFTDLIPSTYTMSFPNFKNLKSSPFWETAENRKHVIINVPSTYPPSEINGFIVSGFVSLDLEKAVQPSSYAEQLEKMDYRVDVDSKKAHKSMLAFLNNLFEVHEKRVKLYRRLWDEIDWDTFMLVFTGSDRLEHFLLDAYENSDHEYHSKFLEYFEEVDKVIGEINDKLNDNDSLIMLSDHGMEQIEANVNVNTFLEEEGFLKLNEKKNKKYNSMKEKTKAFALDPARIYLNKDDKYPRGSVKKGEEEEILDDLIDSFKDLKYNGEKVVRKIYKKDEIYKGKCLDKGPDLVLLPNSGYCFRGGVGKEKLFEQDDVIVGMHTQPDAFLYVKDKDNKDFAPKNPKVEDVKTIMERIR